MEEDVLNALQTRIAYLPGGCDRHGRIIIVVNINNDFQLWNRKCLELSIAYLKRSLSAVILQKGVTVIVDAQSSTTRITRTHARFIYALFGDVQVNLYLVRAEGFWEKHVEPCTKSHTNGEPLVLSKARLSKYFDASNLPEELGGTLKFNYDLWLQQRKSIDEFEKAYERTLQTMEMLHVMLRGNSKAIRPTEAEAELKKCAHMHASVQRNIEAAIEMGNRILTRLNEAYATATTAPTSTMPTDQLMPLVPTIPNKRSETSCAATPLTALPIPTSPTTPPTPTTPAAMTMMTGSLPASGPCSGAAGGATTTIAGAGAGTGAISMLISGMVMKRTLPPDLQCERQRIELRLNEVEKKQTEIRTAWLELLQSIREARELAALEEGVAFVTNWILSTAEDILNRQQAIGCDVRACESLRTAHNALEMECRETYGFYAELLYKIESYGGAREGTAYRDLMSQQEFMHFVCRSFATRLERRRNVLITSLRFFRLVTEYFDRTTAVFESLVMGGVKGTPGDFDAAAGNLQKLKDSQLSLANIERELIKEGEKLSDMLAMPVKDALGRDLHIDYSEDIGNIRDILDTTLARRKIFGDSVELQKLTLEQVTHIHAYELDARMAIQWLDDLYCVMIRCHSHVGCNIHEIQVQKDELQTFQETGKSIYNYGCQLLEASQALRTACKLDVTAPQQMSQRLQRTWHSLLAINQEHMTRLRVSAVFHRSVEEYCQQLRDLKLSVRQLRQPSSSGVSSDSTGESPQQQQQQQQQHQQQHQQHQQQHQQRQQRQRQQLAIANDDNNFDDGDDERPAPPLGATATALRKYLAVREQLLVEVGRMVRLGRLLKTRLKEPFVLDALTGKSVIVEDLTATEIAGSPTADSGHSSNASNETPTPGASGGGSGSDRSPTTIVVNPTGSNGIACNAISSKLQEIAEVAEALDAVIRDVQNDTDAAGEAHLLEMQASGAAAGTTADKKQHDTMRSNSSEDCHSRSTEDDSFATASEGNFTSPHSHSHTHSQSSSFQTASGRTSSFISSGKNSFDASEADDSTFAFELPELNSPISMSFDGSEHSFLSAQQQLISPAAFLRDNDNDVDIDDDDDDQTHELSSVAGIEELHSESVTPTPDDNLLYTEGIPVESETELDLELQLEQGVDARVRAPPMDLDMTTEMQPATMTSVTPEVSACSVLGCQTLPRPQSQLQPQQHQHPHQHLPPPPPLPPHQPQPQPQPLPQQQHKPPNAAWRRSKYYENITKQTIKGFL